MEFNELIVERRSVRAYKDQPVDVELLKKIVEQAQMAPSWKNSQTAHSIQLL